MQAGAHLPPGMHAWSYGDGVAQINLRQVPPRHGEVYLCPRAALQRCMPMSGITVEAVSCLLHRKSLSSSAHLASDAFEDLRRSTTVQPQCMPPSRLHDNCSSIYGTFPFFVRLSRLPMSSMPSSARRSAACHSDPPSACRIVASLCRGSCSAAMRGRRCAPSLRGVIQQGKRAPIHTKLQCGQHLASGKLLPCSVQVPELLVQPKWSLRRFLKSLRMVCAACRDCALCSPAGCIGSAPANQGRTCLVDMSHTHMRVQACAKEVCANSSCDLAAGKSLSLSSRTCQLCRAEPLCTREQQTRQGFAPPQTIQEL